MKRLLALLTFLAVLTLAPLAGATTRYIAQTAGTFSGGSACNGQTAITLATFAGVTLSPGDITYICGTVTAASGVTGSAITIGQSGTSGSHIVLNFDTGGNLQAGAWNAGAIFIAGRQWLDINGGTNGIIQATSNGTSGSFTNTTDNGSCIATGNSSSISNVTIQNVNCQNIYQRTSTTDVFSSNNDCMQLLIATAVTVQNNTCNQMHWGIVVTYGPGSTNSTSIQVNNNTVSNMDHGVIYGDPNVGASTLTSSNCSSAIHDNLFSAMQTWDDSTGGNHYHHDAIHVWANQLTASYSGLCIYNNEFTGNPGDEVSGIFSLESSGTGNFIFNNIVNITSTTATCGDGAITHFTGTGSQGSGNTWVNNVVKVISGAACIIDYGIAESATEVLKNNIAFANETYVASQSPTSSIGTADFNSYQSPAGSNPFYGTCGGGVSFATWKSSCGFDTHGQLVTFTLNSDFTIPTSSALIGSATNLTSLGITALDTGAPQTFGDGGACGTGCLARPSTGAWDPGPYPFSSAGGSTTLTPSSENFGSFAVGSPSSPVTFTVTNNSTTTATSISPSVTGGNTADFAITNTGAGSCSAAGGSLATSASCTFTVVFTPGGAGARSTTLSVSYSGGDGASPITSALSGTGTSTTPHAVSGLGVKLMNGAKQIH
jgi:hypothetical protein